MLLQSKRLVLQPLKKEHAQALFNYRSDKQANQYQGWIPEFLDDVHAFIAKVASEFNVPETWFQFVIIHSENNEIIGDLGVHFIDDAQVELGFTLDKNWQGQGFATEAVKLILNYLFNNLHKHRVIGSVDPENKSSIALLKRLGFRQEAHFKESYYINGRWVDDMVFALLRKEWENR